MSRLKGAGPLNRPLHSSSASSYRVANGIAATAPVIPLPFMMIFRSLSWSSSSSARLTSPRCLHRPYASSSLEGEKPVYTAIPVFWERVFCFKREWNRSVSPLGSVVANLQQDQHSSWSGTAPGELDDCVREIDGMLVFRLLRYYGPVSTLPLLPVYRCRLRQ